MSDNSEEEEGTTGDNSGEEEGTVGDNSEEKEEAVEASMADNRCWEASLFYKDRYGRLDIWDSSEYHMYTLRALGTPRLTLGTY